MQLSRRTLFLSSTASVFALAACSGTGVLTFQQAIADALGIATSLKAEASLIALLFPKILSNDGAPNVIPVSDVTNAAGTGWLDVAVNLLTGLVTTSPIAVSSLSTAEQDINLVLNVLAAIGSAVASAVPASAAIIAMIQAAISLAPAIEALLAQYITKPIVTAHKHLTVVHASVLASRITVMSPEKARLVLHIATVD